MTTDQGQIRKALFLDVLASFGEARLAVTGLSMLPAVWPGDILTVRRHRIEEIEPGDLVLYSRNGQFTMHRVVEVRETGKVSGARCQVPGKRDTGYGIRETGKVPGARCQVPGTIANHQSPITNAGDHQSPITNAGNRQSSIVNHQSRIPNAGSLLTTRGDRLPYLDAPVAPEELLGRVTAIERGRRRVNPRLTLGRRLGAWVLRHSELATRLALAIQNTGSRLRFSSSLSGAEPTAPE